MSNLDTFLTKRNKIKQTLLDAGISEDNILFSNEIIPTDLPAGVIVLEDEKGKNGTNKRFVSTDLNFTIYLVVDAHDIADPDQDIYTLKESVRTAYVNSIGKDFPKVTFYNSRIKSSQKVKIAKIETMKSS